MSAVAETRIAPMGAEGYVAFLRTRSDKERWQLIDGEAMMMTPPTLVHQRIAMNLATRLNEVLQLNRPDLFAMVEVGLRLPDRDDFLPQADVVVVDGVVESGSFAGAFYLAAEILSESNTREYISRKVECYAENPANLYTLVIDQNEYSIEIWSRKNDWRGGLVLRSADDVVDLPEFGLRCHLRELYRGTPLE